MSTIFKPRLVKMMGRPPINGMAMTNAESRARYLAKKKLKLEADLAFKLARKSKPKTE